MEFTPGTSYSGKNAIFMANLSALAYLTPAEIGASTLLPQWDLSVIGVRDIQAIVASNTALRATVIAFRGTQDLSDWMRDASIEQIDFAGVMGGEPAGTVHKGFLEGMMLVWPELLDEIAKRPGNTLYVTGHSLGGALAHAFAASLVLVKCIPVNALYTFGQPRTGNKTFCAVCDAHLGNVYWRFVNFRDVVTRVAPRILMLPPTIYAHAGQVAFMGQDGKISFEEHFWNLFVLTEKVGDRFRDILALPIADHALSRYIANLKLNDT